MRPGAEFPMSHGAPTAAPANGTAPHSPWQSPVPYLFGGLAAMLGLIALALLILACSYWKLSGYLDADPGTDRDQPGSGSDGEKGSAAGAARPAAGFQEHVVVIMAGDERPRFLATPAASRAVVEVELGAAPGVCSCGSGGEEKKLQDPEEGGCAEVSSQPRLRADAGAMSRSHESSSSSSTTALQESSQ
ncbi:protein GLUTAMINE DUMPER 4-like [Phragmites australis]|uniref:protein GLUTAMINE DUMPER 4-like n=1 Tax=Phragmites australis TaxID=29695 RepID=UPI002D76E983|nr:protein GLUTAMINE DUMPER 4-like [Phragmites australis]